MDEILIKLYETFYHPKKYADFRSKIELYYQELSRTMNQEQRLLLLRITDNKDRIIEEQSIDSFICGFELALKLCNELNHYHERTLYPTPED